MATITLTEQDRASIEQIVAYQSEAGVKDVPLDERTATTLTHIFQNADEFATAGKVPFRDRFREQPITTLLQILLLATDA
jgi:hypothetical protein